MEKDIIANVVQQLDIVKIISSYIPLTKKGRNYVGLCPFHDDTNPSLSVSQDKKIFKCFVCGETGDAISFIMKYEKCDFKSAYNKLIDMEGMSEELKLKIKEQPTFNPYSPELMKQIKINEAIQEYISYHIHTNDESCLDYIRGRGIDENTQKTFGLGYLGSSEIVVNYLQKKYGFEKEELEKNDFFRSVGDRLVSPYEHRLIFPIYDKYHYLIGFAGRQVKAKTYLDNKYINPSTTELFEKSKVLYNFYNANQECKQKHVMYFVEGYLDVIAMSIAGYPNTCALMGTALTKEHMDTIKQIKDVDVVFVLDGDKAGQQAMYTIYEQCIQEGIDAKFVTLPDGLDPDDMKDKRVDELKEILENYQYGYEFEISHKNQHMKASFIKQKQEITHIINNFSIQERDVLEKAHFFNLLSKAYDIDKESIKEFYQGIQKDRIQQKSKDIPANEIQRYGSRSLRGQHREN